MAWIWALVSIVVCFAAALAFRLALPASRRLRFIAWFIASLFVALAPCLVPLTALPYRLVSAMFAVAILVKLYDLWMQASPAKSMTFQTYALYLANWFWLVLQNKPKDIPAAVDLKRFVVTFPVALVTFGASVVLFSLDWSGIRFAIEHSVKVSMLAVTVVVVTNNAASAWRLLGGAAWDPMFHPAAARTPADFWRRWNRPAQQFFDEYVFYPAGGIHHPVRGILAAFMVSGLVHEYLFGIAAGRVQGWQFLFFALEGLATVGTIRLRPRGWMVVPFVGATIAFNLTLSVLFFKSVNSVLPFYSPRVY